MSTLNPTHLFDTAQSVFPCRFSSNGTCDGLLISNPSSLNLKLPFGKLKYADGSPT